MAETLVDKLTRTEEGNRLYQQERTILEMTELICEVMQERSISRSGLAKRLSKSKGYITQLLDGEANMTLRTISDVFTALETTVHFRAGRPRELKGTSELQYSMAFTVEPQYFGGSPQEWGKCIEQIKSSPVRGKFRRSEQQLVY